MGKINTQQEIFRRMQRSGMVHTVEKADTIEKAVQNPKVQPIQSVMINPYLRFFHQRKNIIEPQKKISYRTLRRVAEKAWLINTIIGHHIRKIIPFLKPTRDDDPRGYSIVLKDDEQKPTSKDKQAIKYLEQFILNTGEKDSEREDNLVIFGSKLVRDLLTLDQITTEMQRTKAGNMYAFWSVDPATIFRVNEEGYEGDDQIRFIQEVEMQVTAKYTAFDLIFNYQNARTDIDYAGYGYSSTEQAIELITGLINTFAFNASAFTEDYLPRGMLLMGGDADVEDVQALEEYIISIMSGGPMSKWRIPIIPAGAGKDKESRTLDWVSFQKTSQEMQFSQWTEFLWTAAAALYGTDLEELGIRTQRSTALLGANLEPKIQESKARGLATILSFMANHLNKIIDFIAPKYKLRFVGYIKDDVKLLNATRESELRTWKSIDMICAENDVKPYNQPWSKIPMNTNVVQMVRTAQGMQAMGEQGFAGEGKEPERETFEKQLREMEGKKEKKEEIGKSIREVIEIRV